MNPLPPQAYTKDTLVSAYSWIQTQPERIRQLATTPDILVSLYLKAHRDGEEALNRPSIQNFKSELKQLASMMGPLEKELPPAATVTSPALPPFEPPQKSAPDKTPTQSSVAPLDPATLRMLSEAQEFMNLSSEAEALRALVRLGYLKAKALYQGQ
ncbi:MAG: hypothetical protein N2578_01220 [Bdellovibrionaceae bacterium]|nr:hypothetical protein [Pseudobdellovibrionaceae bacterium]